jgi:hypothetical protein
VELRFNGSIEYGILVRYASKVCTKSGSGTISGHGNYFRNLTILTVIAGDYCDVLAYLETNIARHGITSICFL